MKKLPIIRHIRYFWYSWRVREHAKMWAMIGVGIGLPNRTDLDHLARRSIERISNAAYIE